MQPEGQPVIVLKKCRVVSVVAIRKARWAMSLIVQKEFERAAGAIPLAQRDARRNLVVISPIATPPMYPLEPGGPISVIFQAQNRRGESAPNVAIGSGRQHQESKHRVRGDPNTIFVRNEIYGADSSLWGQA